MMFTVDLYGNRGLDSRNWYWYTDSHLMGVPNRSGVRKKKKKKKRKKKGRVRGSSNSNPGQSHTGLHDRPIGSSTHELAKLSSLFTAFRKCLKLQNWYQNVLCL